MRVHRQSVITGLMLAAGLMVTSASARAMEIERFDALSPQDQSRYLVVLLDGSKKLLESQGKRDEAIKIISVFDTKDPGETVPKGMRQFSEDLESARQYQIKTGKTLQVESALLLRFKKLGIEVSRDEFMHLGDGFKPADAVKPK